MVRRCSRNRTPSNNFELWVWCLTSCRRFLHQTQKFWVACMELILRSTAFCALKRKWMSFVMSLLILNVLLSWDSLFSSVNPKVMLCYICQAEMFLSCSLVMLFNKNLTPQSCTPWWVPSSWLPTGGWNPVVGVLSCLWVVAPTA